MKKLIPLFLLLLFVSCEKIGQDTRDKTCLNIFEENVRKIKQEYAAGNVTQRKLDSVYKAECEALYHCQIGE